MNKVQVLTVGFKRSLIRSMDLALIALAFLAAYWLRSNLDYFLGWQSELRFAIFHPAGACHFLSILLTAWLIVIVVLHHVESRERMRTLHYLDELFIVTKGLTISFVILLATTSLYSQYVFSRSSLILFYVFSVVLVGGWRIVLKAFLSTIRRRGYNWVKILVFGAGRAGQLLRTELERHAEFGYRLVGILDDDPTKLGTKLDGVEVLGCRARLEELVATRGVDDVIVAMPSASRESVADILRICERARVNAVVMPGLTDLAESRVAVSHLGSIPLMRLVTEPMQGWAEAGKRAFDFVVALLGLVVLAPLFVVLAVAIRLDSPGPILFRQVRVGRFKHRFTMLKFRSMIAEAEARRTGLEPLNESKGGVIFKMRSDPRVTRVGRFLRRFSLDELPQLWNVLVGDMSLVGPRPPLESEVRIYSAWAKNRLNAMPGLTGLWQVSGRSEIGFDAMVDLDLYYIENWSFWADLKILLRTIPVVLSGRGAY